MNFLKPGEDFPPVNYATSDGLLAVGGNLDVPTLKRAYEHGVFPWYEEGQPVLWWSPDPRMVLFPEKLEVSKSMRQLFRKDAFQVSFNTDFKRVIANCAEVKRPGQDSTWITLEIQKTYQELHKVSLAHSVEVWENENLVGGLYGIYLKEKSVFCGESMFSKVSNASKYGFIKLVEKLKEEDIELIDCQVYTRHLESLGAEEISREKFLSYLE